MRARRLPRLLPPQQLRPYIVSKIVCLTKKCARFLPSSLLGRPYRNQADPFPDIHRSASLAPQFYFRDAQSGYIDLRTL
jgi:hypothetical protein